MCITSVLVFRYLQGNQVRLSVREDQEVLADLQVREGREGLGFRVHQPNQADPVHLSYRADRVERLHVRLSLPFDQEFREALRVPAIIIRVLRNRRNIM